MNVLLPALSWPYWVNKRSNYQHALGMWKYVLIEILQRSTVILQCLWLGELKPTNNITLWDRGLTLSEGVMSDQQNKICVQNYEEIQLSANITTETFDQGGIWSSAVSRSSCKSDINRPERKIIKLKGRWLWLLEDNHLSYSMEHRRRVCSGQCFGLELLHRWLFLLPWGQK